jgi:hypothetical protein
MVFGLFLSGRGLAFVEGWRPMSLARAGIMSGASFRACFALQRAFVDGVVQIGETGMTGPTEKHPRALALMRAQAAVANQTEFKGNVAFVGTQAFWRPVEDSPMSTLENPLERNHKGPVGKI